MKNKFTYGLILLLAYTAYSGSYTKMEWPATIPVGGFGWLTITDTDKNVIGDVFTFVKVEKDLTLASSSFYYDTTNSENNKIADLDSFNTINEEDYRLKISYVSQTKSTDSDRDTVSFASPTQLTNNDYNVYAYKFWAPKLAYFQLDGNDTIPWDRNIEEQTTAKRTHVIVKILEDEMETSKGDAADVNRTCAEWLDSIRTKFGSATWNPGICSPNDLVPDLNNAEGVVLYLDSVGGLELTHLSFTPENSVMDMYIGADENSPKEVTNGTIEFNSLKYLIHSEFPGELNYSLPPGAHIDSAAIFDTDGDGLADSAVAWYDSEIKGEITSVQFSWPDEEKFKDGTFSVIGDNKDIISIEDDFNDVLNMLNKSGEYKSTLLPEDGGKIIESTPFIDKIGPVVTGATIIVSDNSSDPDTLMVRFSKDIDPKFVGEEGLFFLNEKGVAVEAEAISVDDNGLWAFVVKKGLLAAGDELKLNSNINDDIISATDGNVPAKNNQPKIIKSAGNIPPFVSEGSGVYDDNGDGKVDRVTFEFNEPLTEDQKENIKINFHWKDENDSLLLVEIVYDSLVKIAATSDEGERYAWIVPADADVQDNLTSINSRDYGYVSASQEVDIVGEISIDRAVGELKDYMPPVIDSAWISPELKKESSGDKLTLVFSEPIDVDAITKSDFLNFKSGDRVFDKFNMESLKWDTTGTILTLKLAADEELADRPEAADSLVAFGLTDLNGNEISENVEQTMMNGDPRILINSIDLVSFDRSELVNRDDIKPLEVVFLDDDISIKELKKDLTSKGALGHFLDFGPAPLEDEDGNVDIENIEMDYHVFYYTPLGEYVASLEGTIKCTDDAFDGNCFENKKKVFIRWNMKSDEGRIVGVGAYISSLYLYVKGEKDSYKHTEVRSFGIHAGNSPYNVDLE